MLLRLLGALLFGPNLYWADAESVWEPTPPFDVTPSLSALHLL